jgi:predicted lipoprotein with Yx(FWY)xxD motif
MRPAGEARIAGLLHDLGWRISCSGEREDFMRRFSLVILMATLASTLAVSGCVPTGSEPVEPERIAPVNRSSATRLPPTLVAISSSTLGAIVIDHGGFVIYRFDGDSAAPPTSRCVDACAARWLPVSGQDQLRLEGIDRQLVGSLRRPDGSVQLTLAGWPLYGHAGDRMPGDTTGHGLDGAWFAITPDGGRAGPR